MNSHEIFRNRRKIGQFLGQASAVLCGSSSLAFAMYVWLRYPHDRSVSWVMFAVLLISAFAFYAASKQRPVLLIVAFAVTFFPVGLYLALHPHWARTAGIAPLGYLIAAWLIGHKHKEFNSD